eukprot:SAG11_NODE_1201_length_5538_cov_2.793896_5_plen_843_part_00
MFSEYVCPTCVRAAAIQAEVPDWICPLNASRVAEIITCTRIVADSLWPKLEEALALELLDTRVRQFESVRKKCAASYKCVSPATIRSTCDSTEECSEIRGKLHRGEVIDVVEERQSGGQLRLRFAGGWVSENARNGTKLMMLEPVGQSSEVLLPTPAAQPSLLEGTTPNLLGGASLLTPAPALTTPAPNLLGGASLLVPIPAKVTAPAPNLLGGQPSLLMPVSGGPVAVVGGPNPLVDFGTPSGPTSPAVGPAAVADPFGLVVPAAPPAAAAAAADTFNLWSVVAAPAPAGSDGLPLNWTKRESKQYPGKFFYYNSVTKETSWEQPQPPPTADLLGSFGRPAPTTAPAPTPAPAAEEKKKGRFGMKGMRAKAQAAAAKAATLGVSQPTGAPAPAPAPELEPEPAADLLRMFAAPPASPSLAPPVDLLGMGTPAPAAPAAFTAPAAPAVPAVPAGTASAPAPVFVDWVQKQTGVRKIWRPWHARLGAGVLSWAKYETDEQPRDEVNLNEAWRAEPCAKDDLDDDLLVATASGHARAEGLFVLRLSTDIRVCHYFNVGSAAKRDVWLEHLRHQIAEAASAPSNAAPIDGAPAGAAVAGSKKAAGKFLKGIKSKAKDAAMNAAAMSAISAISSGAREFGDIDDDDYDVLLPIGCRARSGLLQKEATGIMHKWEERWFELSNTGKLFYYKAREDVEAGRTRGVIPIAADWRIAPTWRGGREHCIKLWRAGTAATQSEFGAAYFLQCADEAEAALWFVDLQTAILAHKFGAMDKEELMLERAMVKVRAAAVLTQSALPQTAAIFNIDLNKDTVAVAGSRRPTSSRRTRSRCRTSRCPWRRWAWRSFA